MRRSTLLLYAVQDSSDEGNSQMLSKLKEYDVSLGASCCTCMQRGWRWL